MKTLQRKLNQAGFKVLSQRRPLPPGFPEKLNIEKTPRGELKNIGLKKQLKEPDWEKIILEIKKRPKFELHDISFKTFENLKPKQIFYILKSDLNDPVDFEKYYPKDYLENKYRARATYMLYGDYDSSDIRDLLEKYPRKFKMLMDVVKTNFKGTYTVNDLFPDDVPNDRYIFIKDPLVNIYSKKDTKRIEILKQDAPEYGFSEKDVDDLVEDANGPEAGFGIVISWRNVFKAWLNRAKSLEGRVVMYGGYNFTRDSKKKKTLTFTGNIGEFIEPNYEELEIP